MWVSKNRQHEFIDEGEDVGEQHEPPNEKRGAHVWPPMKLIGAASSPYVIGAETKVFFLKSKTWL